MCFTLPLNKYELESKKLRECTAQIKIPSSPLGPQPALVAAGQVGKTVPRVPTPRPPSSSSPRWTSAFSASLGNSAGPGWEVLHIPSLRPSPPTAPRQCWPSAHRAPQPHPYHHGFAKSLDGDRSWEARVVLGILGLLAGPHGHVWTLS